MNVENAIRDFINAAQVCVNRLEPTEIGKIMNKSGLHQALNACYQKAVIARNSKLSSTANCKAMLEYLLSRDDYETKKIFKIVANYDIWKQDMPHIERINYIDELAKKREY